MGILDGDAACSAACVVLLRPGSCRLWPTGACPPSLFCRTAHGDNSGIMAPSRGGRQPAATAASAGSIAAPAARRCLTAVLLLMQLWLVAARVPLPHSAYERRRLQDANGLGLLLGPVGHAAPCDDGTDGPEVACYGASAYLEANPDATPWCCEWVEPVLVTFRGCMVQKFTGRVCSFQCLCAWCVRDPFCPAGGCHFQMHPRKCTLAPAPHQHNPVLRRHATCELFAPLCRRRHHNQLLVRHEQHRCSSVCHLPSNLHHVSEEGWGWGRSWWRHAGRRAQRAVGGALAAAAQRVLRGLLGGPQDASPSLPQSA